MNIQEKIKELKEEIEKERSKRPIRCYAEAIKYGGNQDNENVKILQAQLSAYEEISSKLADFEKRIDEKLKYFNRLKKEAKERKDSEGSNIINFGIKHFEELKTLFREEVLGK